MDRQPTLLIAHTVSPDRSQSLVSKLRAALDGPVQNAVTPAETNEKIPGADILVVGLFDDGWFEHVTELSLIQTLWAGVDSYPLDRIEKQDIMLANAAGVHAEPIAQQVLGYLLQFERGLVQAAHNQQRGVWERVEGGELGGKTLGIIGTGAIGSRVAQLVEPFDMTVIGTKRDTSTVPAGVDELLPADEYHDLLSRSDFVVLSCPLTDETEGMIGIDEFRLLSEQSVLVNVARGEIVDQDALVTALQYGMIRGAALDVFDSEPLPSESVLWNLSNVVITPHMAWRTPRTETRWCDLIEHNYRAIAADDPTALQNRVI